MTAENLARLSSRYDSAISRRDFARVLQKLFRLSDTEGAGNAGRSMRPQPRVQMKKAHER
jgi:hypothetical protein